MFQLSLVLKQVFISPLTLAFQRIFFQFPFTEPQDKKEGMLENSVFKNNGAEINVLRKIMEEVCINVG